MDINVNTSYYARCENLEAVFEEDSRLLSHDFYIIAHVSEELAASFRIFCFECSKVGLTFQ